MFFSKMVNKKFYALIFGILFTILIVLQSCEKKAISTATTKKSNLNEINYLIELGHNYYNKRKFDSAYYYFNKAKNASIIKKDTSRILHSYMWMAEIEINQGDYSDSETAAIEAFPYMKNGNKYPYDIWDIYEVLGNNNRLRLDYKNALYYFTKSLNFKKEDLELQAFTKNNISATYMDMQDYKKAIQILLPLTLKKDFIIDKASYSIILNNLGYSYLKLDNSKSLNYLFQSLKINKQIKNEKCLVTNYINLSEYYQKINSSLSKKYAFIAFKKATHAKMGDERLKSLKLLVQISTGNQSKKYALDYIRINDSLTKARQFAKNQFAKIKYNSNKEKTENQKLKAEKLLQLKKEKNEIITLFCLGGIGIVSTLLFINFLICKNKREKLQTSIDTETRISKKIHDEVANDVFNTIAFAETKDLSYNKNKEILLSNLDSIYTATRNISRENNNSLKESQFKAELKDMITRFNSNDVNIIIKDLDNIDWNTLKNIKKTIVYRVLLELLVNMKKHSKCNLVVLTFNYNKNNLEINYCDNGNGAILNEIISGNGIQNIRNRILDSEGNITFETEPNKGFKTNFTIPL